MVWKVRELSSKKKREENNADLFCNQKKKKKIKVSWLTPNTQRLNESVLYIQSEGGAAVRSTHPKMTSLYGRQWERARAQPTFISALISLFTGWAGFLLLLFSGGLPSFSISAMFSLNLCQYLGVKTPRAHGTERGGAVSELRSGSEWQAREKPLWSWCCCWWYCCCCCGLTVPGRVSHLLPAISQRSEREQDRALSESQPRGWEKRASQTGGGASTVTLYGHADPGKAISSPIFHRSVFTQDSTRGGGCRAIGVNRCRCLMCYHSPRARYQLSAGGAWYCCTRQLMEMKQSRGPNHFLLIKHLWTGAMGGVYETDICR